MLLRFFALLKTFRSPLRQWQERLFVLLIHTSCFLRSVCQIVCVSVDIWLNIRGYFITYPWIFHYASAVTRSFCFALAVNCLHGVGFSHNAVFVLLTQISQISRNLLPSLFFVSRESREKREDFFHRWIFGLTQISRISQMARRFARACRLCRVLSAGWYIRAQAMYAFVRFVRSVWDKFLGPGLSRFSRDLRETYSFV